MEKMWKDAFSASYEAYDELLQAQKEMEQDGRWIPSVTTKTMALSPVTQMEMAIVKNKLDNDPLVLNHNSRELSEEVLADTSFGSGLLLNLGGNVVSIRDTAMNGLHNAAKLSGSAFGRMEKTIEAEVLQHGLDVAQGSSTILLRCGKVSGIHSSKYVVMPISELLTATETMLKKQFGGIRFTAGNITHAITTARWALVDAQPKLMQKYQDALSISGIAINPDWMPVVDFSTSDTASSAAVAVPGFLDTKNGDTFRFSKGIEVRHERTHDKSGKEGVELYEYKVSALYSMWEESAQKIKEMASFPFRHPENALVEIANKIGMPKKYASQCLNTLEAIAINAPVITMHEIYLCLAMAPRYAKNSTTPPSPATLVGLEEMVARILTIPTKEWPTFDMAGHSGWKVTT